MHYLFTFIAYFDNVTSYFSSKVLISHKYFKSRLVSLFSSIMSSLKEPFCVIYSSNSSGRTLNTFALMAVSLL